MTEGCELYERLLSFEWFCRFQSIVTFLKGCLLPKSCDLYLLLAINLEVVYHFLELNSYPLFHKLLTKQNRSIKSVYMIRCIHFEFNELVEV